jgi:glycosyltransferase involved in cell wall biosynthesis
VSTWRATFKARLDIFPNLGYSEVVKILIVNSLYPPYVLGGAERSVQDLAEALAALDIEIVVASTVGRGGASTKVVNGVKVVHLPIANLYWPFDRVIRSPAHRKLWHLIDAYNPAMKAAVARLIRQERPSVVHTNNLQGISVAAWRAASAARIPILHTLHDYYLTCARCSRYRDGYSCDRTCWGCLPFLLARRRAAACVAGVVGVSRFILDHHCDRGFFGGAKFRSVIRHVCPPAVRLRTADSTASPVTFGYLGRLTPEKGVNLLLDTFAARSDGGWRLLVAGEEADEGYRRSLGQRVAGMRDRSAIRFLGWVDPVQFFTQIDVLLVPSLWQEPLPRVIQEAYTAGVPIVGSRRGGIPELIEDSVTGLLFDPDVPKTLGAVVDRILEDRSVAGRLGQNARRRARENAPEHIVEEYRNAYRAVLGSATEAPPV